MIYEVDLPGHGGEMVRILGPWLDTCQWDDTSVLVLVFTKGPSVIISGM
jgi:hypothetical protein